MGKVLILSQDYSQILFKDTETYFPLQDVCPTCSVLYADLKTFTFANGAGCSFPDCSDSYADHQCARGPPVDVIRAIFEQVCDRS